MLEFTVVFQLALVMGCIVNKMRSPGKQADLLLGLNSILASSTVLLYLLN